MDDSKKTQEEFDSILKSIKFFEFELSNNSGLNHLNNLRKIQRIISAYYQAIGVKIEITPPTTMTDQVT